MQSVTDAAATLEHPSCELPLSVLVVFAFILCTHLILYPPPECMENVLLQHIGTYSTRIKELTFYGRTTSTATGVLRSRLRAYYAYGYGRTTPTAMGVLGLRLRAYLV